jgi:hypothetical protein
MRQSNSVLLTTLILSTLLFPSGCQVNRTLLLIQPQSSQSAIDLPLTVQRILANATDPNYIFAGKSPGGSR